MQISCKLLVNVHLIVFRDINYAVTIRAVQLIACDYHAHLASKAGSNFNKQDVTLFECFLEYNNSEQEII